MRAIIIDDEQKARENLSIRLRAFNIQIVAEATNVDEAFELIQNYKPDVIFLDIAMPEKSGFDLLQMFDSVDFEVVFVTAFDQYAIQAFETNALGYILKPIDQEKLKITVDNLLKRRYQSSINRQIENAKFQLKYPLHPDQILTIKSSEGIDFIRINDIVRIEADGRYSFFYLSDGSKILSSKNLSHYYDLLQGYGLIQTHKGHIINKRYLKKYDSDGVIYLSDGSNVPLSRRNKKNFLDSI